ncbi:multiple inositol polyphosphate phosphatase 1-like [Adelges cooleyi]|uniref:multiple inositol polyphosphate phosphatase 1-like n=1 Tax=Adelges cooleyi TaxID=133065 RepID=UPI00217F37EF|nr:multiple inositol polyphosphate phosphatase 1-like [Adelges cooleyi]
MYEVSVYESSIDKSAISPWYSVFSQEDLEILENADDIFGYYLTGYGNPFNAKLACPMAIRLEESFKKKINGEGPDGVFYFAHNTNILSLCIMLGLGDGDVPLTFSNYKYMKDPNWRSSRYGPWAANFMVVFLEGPQKYYKVSFYFNEKLTPITLQDGSSCTECPWLDIQHNLLAFISDNDCVNFVATNTVKNYKDTNPYWYSSTKTTYKLVSAKEIIVPHRK